jgi:tRNA A37 threonylcarbamoyladenosine dehydratase
MRKIEVLKPDEFEQEDHFYPKALNSQLHAMVSHFFHLDHDRIVKRYSHLNPQVDTEALTNILKYQSKHFFWGGADFMLRLSKEIEKWLSLKQTHVPRVKNLCRQEVTLMNLEAIAI